MSSLLRGLKGLDAKIEARKPQGGKVRWVKLDDGEKAKIRFVNETDSDSKSYDEARGLTLIVEEHTNPKDFRRKALCTMEDAGQCVGCEMHQKDFKAGWRAKMRFYTNVLVDNGKDEPYIGVWSMGVMRSTTFDTIREVAAEDGAISNRQWTLKRSGEGTETTYTLLPGAIDTKPFDWSKYEIPSLDDAVKQVPYAEQEAFYLSETNIATTADADW